MSDIKLLFSPETALKHAERNVDTDMSHQRHSTLDARKIEKGSSKRVHNEVAE